MSENLSMARVKLIQGLLWDLIKQEGPNGYYPEKLFLTTKN